MGHHSLLRDPALEAEHNPNKPYDQVDAGHLVLPDGSLISSTDYAFLTACAPYVLALHRQAEHTTGEVKPLASSGPTTDTGAAEPTP